MSKGWRVVAAWGGWIGFLALLQLIFTPYAIEFWLLGGSALGMIVLGLVTLGGEARRTPPGPETSEPVALPQTSAATVWLALGIAIFVAGWEFGQWMVGIGAGVAVFGAGGVIRELRWQRRR